MIVAEIVGDTVELSHPNVPEPVHFKYLFLVDPSVPEPYYSLENVAGIPAATIISDDDFMPSGRTGGLTPAQAGDRDRARALTYIYDYVSSGDDQHFQLAYTHDDTIDQVNVRIYRSSDLKNWVEVATSGQDYDGAPPSNADVATYGNWISSVSGTASDRRRDVVIQDPDPVGNDAQRFYKIEFTP